MHDARGGNQLIRGITTEIETGRSAGYGHLQWPSMKSRECTLYIGVIQVQGDSSELRELCQFPEGDGCHTPRLFCQKIPFARSYVAFQCVNQDVRVKVQHWRPIRYPW